jgi:adenylate cyclase
MAREVERKFLVCSDAWKPRTPGVRFRQGYLSRLHERIVRVRTEGHRAVLTVKGITTGVSRLEFEYEIPVAEATQILDRLCELPLVDKTR